jgi:hypothetical protein
MRRDRSSEGFEGTAVISDITFSVRGPAHVRASELCALTNCDDEYLPKFV